jgi:hypothetical protein
MESDSFTISLGKKQKRKGDCSISVISILSDQRKANIIFYFFIKWEGNFAIDGVT